LRQNLHFLAEQGLKSNILILDSSDRETQSQNAEMIAAVQLSCEHITYEPSILAYHKFIDGIRRVTTQFSSFCPDDDLLLVSGLARSLSVLREAQDVTLAHGYYFMFDAPPDGLHVDLTWLIYAAPSLDQPDPQHRVAALMRSYQALCYGVFRTSVLLQSYEHAGRLQSSLFSELISSLVPILIGKAIRVPVFYMGRRHGPAVDQRVHWHPLEWFLQDAQGLLESYVIYRAEILSLLDSTGYGLYENNIRIIDVIHFDYLQKHLPDLAKDIIISQEMRGNGVDRYWSSQELQLALIHAHTSQFSIGLRPSLTSRVSSAFNMQDQPESHENIVWPRSIATTKRTYRFHKSFLDDRLSEAVDMDSADILNLVQTLDHLPV
jgi:glycosyltransferase domain-containing protein